MCLHVCRQSKESDNYVYLLKILPLLTKYLMQVYAFWTITNCLETWDVLGLYIQINRRLHHRGIQNIIIYLLWLADSQEGNCLSKSLLPESFYWLCQEIALNLGPSAQVACPLLPLSHGTTYGCLRLQAAPYSLFHLQSFFKSPHKSEWVLLLMTNKFCLHLSVCLSVCPSLSLMWFSFFSATDIKKKLSKYCYINSQL